jgi:hypothetical protein
VLALDSQSTLRWDQECTLCPETLCIALAYADGFGRPDQKNGWVGSN